MERASRSKPPWPGFGVGRPAATVNSLWPMTNDPARRQFKKVVVLAAVINGVGGGGEPAHGLRLPRNFLHFFQVNRAACNIF